MSAWQTPAEAAEGALIDEDYGVSAEHLVKTVLNHIAEPDGDMLDAGARAIDDALPNQAVSKQFRIDLAGKIWRAMFERVQR